jgi:hypothetical protein
MTANARRLPGKVHSVFIDEVAERHGRHDGHDADDEYDDKD